MAEIGVLIWAVLITINVGLLIYRVGNLERAPGNEKAKVD